MKKSVAILVFTLWSVCSFAQQSVTFRPQASANKKYVSEFVTKNDMVMEFDAKGQTKEKLQQGGMEKMAIFQESKMPYVITTSKAKPDGSVPAEMKYGEVTVSQTVNGEKTSIPSPASGLVMTGYYKDSQFNVEDIKGENLTDEMKATMKTSVDNVLKSINFPKTPVKIGESFTDNTPMNMPLGQLGTLNMNIKTVYTLKKISGGIAYFDLVQTLTMDSKMESVNMSATGTGKGTTEFNLTENFLTKYDSILDMEMTIKISDEMSVKAKSKAISSNVVTISKI
ncbi:MAG: hypothetical protein EOO50_01295 [Flavobacterium sp.]|uniref:DUF6263 family protein n=1 Tax=Flavobacterium sp. TaxID=239 RepID=UPI001222A165|nr:DUF6263 family protein [Flavobacterium sp.]RZJ68456.1 MAG: hypothetical protein EOO50_01295 [Flavobacterium sp.]